MAWYPAAANHNIPPGSNDPPITPRIVVVHTMVGTIESADAWFRGGSGGVEAHFGVAMDGRVWQWRDTAVQADAQAAGNDYCISVETEDGGDPSRRWTEVQALKLDLLITWIGHTHQIPMRLVQSTSERGIGYHRQFDEWNPNKHSCPGDVRLAQLVDELIPALQEVDMSLSPDDLKAVRTVVREELVRAVQYVTGRTNTVYNSNNTDLDGTVTVKDVLEAMKATGQ
jgi:N-acetylmuramoyl-L-alanine amidase